MSTFSGKPAPPGSRLHRPIDPALSAGLDDDDLEEVDYAADVWRSLADARRLYGGRPTVAGLDGARGRGCRPLLRALTAEDAIRLIDLGLRRRHPRGTALFDQGQPADSVVVILEGRVKVSAEAGGRQILLEVRGPGDLVGEAAALEGLTHQGTALAIEPAESIAVSVAEFSRFLAGSPRALRLLLRTLSCSVAELQAERVRQAALDTGGRLAERLVKLCEHFGQQTARGIDLRLEISQEELAGSIGSSHKAVAHALGDMRRQGWLESGRRHITVRDLDALRRRCQV